MNLGCWVGGRYFITSQAGEPQMEASPGGWRGARGGSEGFDLGI